MDACGDSIQDVNQQQEDEVVALSEIYASEFCDLRKKDTWKVPRPPEIVLQQLKPSESNTPKEAFVSIDLRVKCGARYPHEKPSIFLENASELLERKHIRQLKSELESLAQEAAIESRVCILDLAQHVHGFLYEHNRPPAKSFHEQMLIKEQQAKEKEEAAERRERARRVITESAEIEEQIEKQKQKGNTRQRLRDSMSEDEMSRNRSVSRRGDSACPRCQTERQRRRASQIRMMHLGDERTILLGQCLGHGPRNTVVFHGLDADSRLLLAVQEWRFVLGKTSSEKERKNLQEKLNHVTTDMAAMYKLAHRNLVKYLASSIAEDAEKFVVQIACEFVGGPNLESFLHASPDSDGLPLQQIRYYTQEMLDTLEFLHGRDIPHKSLRPSSVILDNDNSVRMTDYCIDKRLQDAYETVNKTEHFDPDNARITIGGRSAKKADIFSLGRIVLDLYNGHRSDCGLPQIPKDTPGILRDFLSRCLCRVEADRWGAAQLKEHAFLTNPLPVMITAHPSLRLTVSRVFDMQDDEDDDEEEEEESSSNFASAVPETVDKFGESRLRQDFDVLDFLGKGGYGSVIKVKCKLDERVYAVKSVRLDPKRKSLKRRITREVKVLARLKHDNVVRYFFSWLERAVVETKDAAETKNAEPQANPGGKGGKNANLPQHNSLGLVDDIDAMSPRRRAGFSDTWSEEEEENDEDDADDDDEDEEEAEGDEGDRHWHSYRSFSTIGLEDEDEEEEEKSSTEKRPSPENEEDDSEDGEDEEEEEAPVEYLFMLMEFCERSTLRSAIDVGLYMDQVRVIRLFREIVEGLVHVHEQGMIHRDLKPVNIFLDSSDHVKIGDFGLATTNIGKGKVAAGSLDPTTTSGDGQQTGKVGTIHYVAPEMLGIGGKFSYDQKVDIYSLGIIFFEMCYRPLTTNMERAMVLSKLRSNDITIPSDFAVMWQSDQIGILTQLLQHNPKDRPTSKELLEKLPAATIEENEMMGMFMCALEDREGPRFQQMMGSLFDQTVSSAADFTYDLDLTQKTSAKAGQHLINRAPSHDTQAAHAATVTSLKEIFARHVASELHTPLLMPRSDLYSHVAERQCSVVNRNGVVVSLPYDLRVPFARFVAKSEITEVKRYALDKVYREQALFGTQPKEINECAFDIVTPIKTIASDFEIIYLLHEIVQLPCLGKRTYILRMNHTSIISGILSRCGIAPKHHNEVCQMMWGAMSVNTSRQQQPIDKVKDRTIQMLTDHYKLNNTQVDSLFNFMELSGNRGNVASRLRRITRADSPEAALVKAGLAEIEKIESLMKSAEMPEFELSVAPGLTAQCHLYSGLFFQLECPLPRMKSSARRQASTSLVTEVLAVGGRFDRLIDFFKHPKRRAESEGPLRPTGVGVSLAIDRIVALEVLGRDSKVKGGTISDEGQHAEVFVMCSNSPADLQREVTFLHKAWKAGLRCSMTWQATAKMIAQSGGRSSAVVLFSADDDKFVNVRLPNEMEWKKPPINDAIEAICKSRQKRQSEVAVESSPAPTGFSMRFVYRDDVKLLAKERRRTEARVETKLACLAGNNFDIVVTDLETSELICVRQHLKTQAQSENEFKNSYHLVFDCNPKKHRHYFQSIFDAIFDLKFVKRRVHGVLVGVDDFRLLPFV